MISWVPQERAHVNKWYWICGLLAFCGEFAVVYFIVGASLITSFITAVIVLLLIAGTMLYALYHVLPIAIALSYLGVHLKYRRKEKTIPWENITKILKQDLRAYGGAFGLYIYMKNGKTKRLGGDAETLEKIYNQFQSYKQSRKGD